MINKGSIVLITNPSNEAGLLAQELLLSNNLNAIVIENKVKARKNWKIFTIELILGKNILEYLLIILKPRTIRKILIKEFWLKNKSRKAFAKKYRKKSMPNVAVHYTSDCNSTKSINFINNYKPDIIFIWGVGIIKKEIIQIPKKHIINCHFSKLPYYKGVFSEFWICYFKDYDKAGITFHEVVQKLDAGKIIRFVNNIKTNDPFEMRYKNIELLLNHCNEVINDLINNSIELHSQDEIQDPSLFKFSDITFETKEQVYLNI